jgi:hypothetical protein
MGHLTGRRLAASVLLAVALSALAGCGGATEQAQDPAPAGSTTESPSEDPEESEEPEKPEKSEPATEVPADAPDCQDVWADGKTLPRFYQGCVDDAGAYVERDAVGCSSGQRLAVFDDAFWGVLGGTIYAAQGSLDDDREYRAATRRCAA